MFIDQTWNINRPGDGPETAAAFVSTYEPRHVNSEVWTQIADVVRQAVLCITAREPTAKKYCSHAAAFVAWASVEGSELTLDSVFTDDMIDRYIQLGMPQALDSTRATRRSILRRLARRCSPALANVPDPSPIPYRRLRAPYAGTQVAAYIRLASAQPTPGRRRSLLAVLALGLGCGLDCEDLAWVRGCDVELALNGAVSVRVCGGRRPRSVVCLSRYEAQLLSLAEPDGEDLLIGGRTLGRHNVTSVTLGRLLQDRSLPPLVVGRLRSTWLLSHLQANTPLSLIMTAAGLQTVRPLEDLLHHLPELPASDAVAALRGSA